nr:hypothetical protein [Tanacetum cinerariifolium]
MAGNDDDDGEELAADEDDEVESNDLSILNSLIGHGSPRSLLLCEKIGTGDVQMLIDNGRDESLRMKRISLHRMQALLETENVYVVYEFHSLPIDAEDLGTSHMAVRGVKIDPKKIATILEWPLHTTQRQVRVFLGFTGYHRRFIRGYAIVAPLTYLLQKDGFKWRRGEEAKSFEDLKQHLSNVPLLGLLDFDQAFIVEADASGYGIGVVLLQNNRPISYFSRKLGSRMRIAATY